MTPLVVYVELLCTPVALLASFLGSDSLLNFAIGMICQLHIGISISIRNAVLLSFVACSVWCVFLPVGWKDAAKAKKQPRATTSNLGHVISTLLVGGMIGGNIWFETIGTDCTTDSLRKIWSTLLHNRWNVFIGAEEYVTWSVSRFYRWVVFPFTIIVNFSLTWHSVT